MNIIKKHLYTPVENLLDSLPIDAEAITRKDLRSLLKDNLDNKRFIGGNALYQVFIVKNPFSHHRSLYLFDRSSVDLLDIATNADPKTMTNLYDSNHLFIFSPLLKMEYSALELSRQDVRNIICEGVETMQDNSASIMFMEISLLDRIAEWVKNLQLNLRIVLARLANKTDTAMLLEGTRPRGNTAYVFI